MDQKRLRIFAGPNGSGKSSIIKLLPASLPLGYYINPDDIDKQIAAGKGIELCKYGINADTKTLHSYFKKSSFPKEKSDSDKLISLFYIENNVLRVQLTKNLTPPYSAAIIADFLREEEMKAGNSFSFETVMSHESRVALMERATKAGYKVYLYFICIDDYKVNIERVKNRVAQGGHNVNPQQIKERYFRTLDLLYNALNVCYKSYLFDNSHSTREVARVNRDKTIHISLPPQELPNWFIKHVINKLGN